MSDRASAGEPPQDDPGARNREHYDALSGGQEDYWRKMAAPRMRVSTFLKHLGAAPTGRLVDLGCGNGRLLEEIRARFPGLALTGVDFSEPQIRENARRVAAIDWRVVNLDQPASIPPELRGQFDHVVASEIIEHLQDPANLLASALALVRPGGRLLLSTQSGPVRETERRVGHVRHFTQDDLRALLARVGWQPVEVWNCGFPFHDLSKWWANRDPDGTMAQFGGRAYGPKENLICYLLRMAFLLNSDQRGAQLFGVARAPSDR